MFKLYLNNKSNSFDTQQNILDSYMRATEFSRVWVWARV